MFCYLAGMAEGQDLGWQNMKEKREAICANARPALNDVVTMATIAEDMVRWYQQALDGAYFKKPEMLAEFRRIQTMAMRWRRSVPTDTWPTARAAASIGKSSTAYVFRAR